MGDQQLWAEIALISEVSYMPESLATYRSLDESASRSKDEIRSLQFAKSVCEMRLYLCDKHKLSGKIREYQEYSWCDNSLRIAYHSRNMELADEVRRKSKIFTLKDWLRYYAVKKPAFYHAHRLAYCIYRSTVLSPKLFGNNSDKWP
jgi:hypothetical protein